MSKMGDYRIWVTEQVEKMFPGISWEEASYLVDEELWKYPTLCTVLERAYLKYGR